MPNYSHPILIAALLASPVVQAQEVRQAPVAESSERHLRSDEPTTRWSVDPELLDRELGDRLEQRDVLGSQPKTVKLKNVIPPIRFESGVADIPSSSIEKLRSILDGMHGLDNVRLHLVGHADDQPLSDRLEPIYGDNAGLSRERAGEVAEFIQSALALKPEALSFEWAGDTQPIASNTTGEGRAQNRRVEVEVWYDEAEPRLEVEEIVVPADIKRVKVCRMETVCKLRYREGHARRAQVKNLVAPLHYGEDTVGVPKSFVQQIREALHNLRSKQNVTVKFIGFTDDVPLRGRDESIYGTHLALSRARAHRTALAIQDGLDLPTAAVASDGRGSEQAVAANDTPHGRSLNRRVEVEFWYDDPLQELPDEPQLCPEAAAAEVVTKVYEPSWGKIEALPIEGGQAQIPVGYAEDLRRAMGDLADKSHVRLRFIGYTRNETLDRRTAGVYGDDIGLSASRARRTMERIQAELGLSSSQAEHEGRGYVQSDDVVNSGFVPGEISRVAVQVVYDELAVLDDYEGVEVTPLTRELAPKNPLGLNLMRITVDGDPIDDPARSSADIQRCTDVALQKADIQFRFDNLRSERQLSVSSPSSVPLPEPAEDGASSTIRFRMHANYTAFIERSEVRIFDRGQSVRATPLYVIEVGRDGAAEWRPDRERFAEPVELLYVLRAYDAEGRFDETAPQRLSLVRDEPPAAPAAEPAKPAEATKRDDRVSAFENGLAVRNIPLGSGTIKVEGKGVPPDHTVWLAGQPVAVDEQGNFAAETILPSGLHTVEVAVLDAVGNGELYLRDLEFEQKDWFYVGMADLTLSSNSTDGPANALVGENPAVDLDSSADGQLAFYVDGKLGEGWRFTASADTREGPVEDLFTNFLDKSPESLFRRIDPDYYYPTYGDDGTVEEMAPTMGKFFMKLKNGDSHALWGNFKIGYVANELAHVDRGLYGANLHYQTPSTTSFGEQRLVIDGFAAEPGTVPSREEFRGTGGSLYFLRRQDLLPGSERVRIEVRDRDSGLVSSVVHLRPGSDYDLDYLQGRVLLSEPLAATVDDNQLIRGGGSLGDEAWLVVQYEYTAGFEEMNTMASGGQGHFWLGDFVRLGLTANNNAEGEADSSLYGADMTLRKSGESWLKVQAGKRDGLASTWLRSDDGGFGFVGADTLGSTTDGSDAYRADLSLGFGDILPGSSGRLSLYAQTLDAGYSVPGLSAFSDTRQFGGLLRVPITDRWSLSAKADSRNQTESLETRAAVVDLGYRLTDRWSLSAGVRNELREDNSPVVLTTQEEGSRTDAGLQLAFDSQARWRTYGFAQTTLSTSGTREDNGRLGVGGSYRLSDRVSFNAEASHGDLGPAAKLGTSYQPTDRTTLYLNYGLENELSDTGIYGRRGNLIAGARTRLSDSASVYLEDRYQHAGSATGLTHATGINLAPADRWNLGSTMDIGTLIDRDTAAEIERKAGGVRVGYGFDKIQFSSGVEYRFDETEQLDGTQSDRTTYLFRNNLRFQLTPDWRVVGRLNHSFSDSSVGEFYDGGYTEGVFGFAYRPVKHDRLNALAKYTYFYNLPATDQFALQGTDVEFVQKSHVASVDLMYDLLPNLSVGGKYAYRLGEVSLDREDPEFFQNDAHLVVLRADWRILADWETSVEYRILALPDLDDRRNGALIGVYRYVGDRTKVGIGYNFTDFSDDLTDLSYENHGFFINFVIGM